MRKPILGDDVAIDIDRLLVSRLLVQANSGGGKSYAIRRLLEQTFGLCQHIVLDPEGEFHTLREQFDYVLCGKGGEAAATLDTAELLAVRLLELGVSAIVDISELGQNRPAFVARFLDALLSAPRELWHPVMVVVDEAHRYCPEQGRARRRAERSAVEDSAAAVISLMDSGRKRGFCGVLATQRVSKLSKDATAECNNKLIGRSVEVDAKRAAEELGLASREAMQSLRKLHAGEFYVFGPAFSDEVRTFRVGPVKTTHPEAGKAAPPPTPPRAEVLKVLGKLKDLPADAAEEARSSTQLRARVRQLEAQLQVEQAAKPAPVVERVEVPVIDPKTAAALIESVKLLGQTRERVAADIERLRSFAEQLAPSPAAIQSASPQTGRKARPRAMPTESRPTATSKPAGSERRSQGVTAGETASPRSASPDDVLDAIATLTSISIEPTVTSIAAWLGVHPKTKTLLTAIGALRADGMLDGLRLTGNGQAVARCTNAPPGVQRDRFRAGLPESQHAILDVISSLATMGIHITHNAVAAWLGVHPKTKTLLEDLGKLRKRGYLDGLTLTLLGERASNPYYAHYNRGDLLVALDDSPRRIAEAVLNRGRYETISELAADLGVHPKTKSLLDDLGKLRSRGLLTDGWPIQPTAVFPGATP